MKKVFISQPMFGRSESEIMGERAYIKNKIEEFIGEEVEVIETYYKENVPENVKRVWLLGDSIKLMNDADIVYFVDGWENSIGCRVERMCALEYGFHVMEGNDVIKNNIFEGM